MSNKKLSSLQKRVYVYLSHVPGNDIDIRKLHDIAYSMKIPPQWTSRQLQQRMGPLISRINAKLEGEAIQPGELKRTYRLVTLPKAK